jgi:hypothetical protein
MNISMEPTKLNALEIAVQASDHIGVNLAPASKRFKNLFASGDGQVAVLCLTSSHTRSGARDSYWFGYYGSQEVELANYKSAYVALGCGPGDLVFLVPCSIFDDWAAKMNFTDVVPGNPNRRRRQVSVQGEAGRRLRDPYTGYHEPPVEHLQTSGCDRAQHTRPKLPGFRGRPQR